MRAALKDKKRFIDIFAVVSEMTKLILVYRCVFIFVLEKLVEIFYILTFSVVEFC